MLTKKRRGRPSNLDGDAYVNVVRLTYPYIMTRDLASVLNVPVRTLEAHAQKLGLTQGSPAGPTSTPGELSETSEADSHEFTASVTPSASAGGK